MSGFDDDLHTFVSDFAVTARLGALEGKVLLNKPDIAIFDQQQVTGDYNIRYLVDDFPDLKADAQISIEERPGSNVWTNYKIKGKPMAITDGRFYQAELKKP